MPKFVIEREIPGAGNMTEAELHEVAMRSVQALRELGPQIQWLHTYITDDKVYCVYLAPDESVIQEHARKAGFPRIASQPCAGCWTRQPRNKTQASLQLAGQGVFEGLLR